MGEDREDLSVTLVASATEFLLPLALLRFEEFFSASDLRSLEDIDEDEEDDEDDEERDPEVDDSEDDEEDDEDDDVSEESPLTLLDLSIGFVELFVIFLLGLPSILRRLALPSFCFVG